MLFLMKPAQETYTDVIAAFARTSDPLLATRNWLQRLCLESQCEADFRGRPVTFEGLLSRAFRGTRADRWARTCRVYGAAALDNLPGLDSSALLICPWLLLPLVAAAAIEATALGWMAISAPRRYGRRNRRRGAFESRAFLFRFAPVLAYIATSIEW